MSKRRLQSTERGSSRTRQSTALATQKFAGISLSGGKNAKTVIAVLEFYPEAKRLVLSHLVDGIKAEGRVSGDDLLIGALNSLGPRLKRVGVDVPLTLPKCATCELKCPGIRNCDQEHVLWFWKNTPPTRERRLFTPYTQRPVEAWAALQKEGDFHVSDALGANTAPLAARMRFLKRRLPELDFVEVFPKLSLWKIGQHFRMMKRHLKFHKHSIEGDKSRLYVLQKLTDSGSLFLYHQDLMRIVQNGNAFDSLICALTAFYDSQGEVLPRPTGFPKDEAWVSVPELG